MKKKLLAVLLSAAMVVGLVACGGSGSSSNTSTSSGSAGGSSSSDAGNNDMKIAMITDSGDITDMSFNQTTYEACKAWGEANGADFKYFKPESDSDESRNASVDQAVAEGYNIIVMPGYMFAAALVAQSDMYPDVKFIALDVAEGDICEKGVGEGYDYNPANWTVTDYYNEENTFCATYQEEISGYLAGQAAVKLGYKHPGFLGGMAVPAVMRFGFGFVQGVNDAAKELGIENEVEVEYVYGGQFYGDADITAYMDTWYSTKGVDVVFACGGGIYTSAVDAAKKIDGAKVIGVDADQSGVINEYAGDDTMTVTSAMKGLAPTINMVLTAIKDGKWGDYAGKIENLGLVSKEPTENYVQIPYDTTQWGEGFTQDDYKATVADIYDGKITISSDISAMPKVDVKVNDYGNIK